MTSIGKVLKINCHRLTKESKYSVMYELNTCQLGEGLTLGVRVVCAKTICKKQNNSEVTWMKKHRSRIFCADSLCTITYYDTCEDRISIC